MKIKGKNAISLIVLVITILVLSILAATVIISLNNTNVINQASSGVDKYNKKQYEEKLNMAYANWLLDNVGTTFNEENISDLGSYDFDASELPNGYKVTVKNNVPQLIEVDIWDGVSVATSFSSGTGTESDPYIISTAAEFAYLSKIYNDRDGIVSSVDYYELSTDIDLNNKPFSPINMTTGFFNGNNNTIYNINIEVLSGKAALFGDIGSDGSDAGISNLIISGGTIKGTSVAGFACDCMGNITNCHNNSVAIIGDTAASGICCTMQYGSIKDCSNSAYVEAESRAAGMFIESAFSGSAENCSNYGNIQSFIANGIGPILQNEMTGPRDCTSNCLNYGAVEGEIKSAAITSYEPYMENYFTYNNDCYNYGTVTGGTIYTYDEAQ